MTNKPKVLLLNPPGKRVYLRDYFCSKVSQADYINHPIDLVYLSGLLKDSFELHVIDAIAEKLSISKCLQRIQAVRPEVIVGLIGSVSYAEDVPFYQQVHQRIGAKIILIGDVLIERREERLAEMPFISAFLHDFSSEDLLHYLRNGDSAIDAVKNMTVRSNGRVRAMPIEQPKNREFNLPIPQHRLFLGKDYRYPFVRHPNFATVMTEFGCPYSCTFCVMSTLGWKIRPVENVLTELELLSSLNVRELFFLDQTFGIQKERAHALLTKMTEARFDFGWVCFSRPDILDDELLRAMKAAGCHTIILGLESGNEEILAATKKEYNKEEVKAGFHRCTKYGIRTVATVILGLPEESEETFAETMTFLKQVNPDFASFNVAVPRMGTPFRKTAVELGLTTSNGDIMDQSGNPVALPSLTLSRHQIASLKKRAVRDFYLNSAYLKRRLKSMLHSQSRGVRELSIQLRQGIGLVRNYFSEE
ncbi:radical SAM protein [candidate division KSB1 bacterium]|nr:radical SAM protein [candidate division KSB1 bacterium]NIR70963.1 radical SAM protein [candidate division KSB1 bacterium]NIS24699.1 radical SAM protein [candidate division KSB1 bacterium]NIT71608.1 radical SAM protein [candidate division KSB1 bacterium]NIU25312.1 radical SAM protein [candidate division KSB1 bacterium]